MQMLFKTDVNFRPILHLVLSKILIDFWCKRGLNRKSFNQQL